MRIFCSHTLTLLRDNDKLTIEFGPHVAKAGTQVIIPYRDEDDKRHLKVTGDLGQIVSMVCSPFPRSFFVFHTLYLNKKSYSLTTVFAR